jgi:hypothetical protein
MHVCRLFPLTETPDSPISNVMSFGLSKYHYGYTQEAFDGSRYQIMHLNENETCSKSRRKAAASLAMDDPRDIQDFILLRCIVSFDERERLIIENSSAIIFIGTSIAFASRCPGVDTGGASRLFYLGCITRC